MSSKFLKRLTLTNMCHRECWWEFFQVSQPVSLIAPEIHFFNHHSQGSQRKIWDWSFFFFLEELTGLLILDSESQQSQEFLGRGSKISVAFAILFACFCTPENGFPLISFFLLEFFYFVPTIGCTTCMFSSKGQSGFRYSYCIVNKLTVV